MNVFSDPRVVTRLTRDTVALVMAGGRGSRLRQLTSGRSKPAVPFGGKFRIIDFALSNCVNSGIRRIGVLTQYKSLSLLQHLQQGWSFMRGPFGEFVELLPAEQRSELSSWYAGTADAVYQNLDFIRTHQPAYVLILAGDHIYKMDYGAMLAHHVESGAEVTVGCLEVPLEEAREFGVMAIEPDTRITAFTEKPAAPQPIPGRPDVALASMGIYVFNALFLLDWLYRDAGTDNSTHDFGRDVIPAAIGAARVCAYPFRDLYEPGKQGYWRDVGTVDAFWRANLELTEVVPELNLYDDRWPIWTRFEPSPPAKFILGGADGSGVAADSLVSGGCVVAGAAVRRSVLFTRARVEPGSTIEQSLLLPDAHVGRGCRIVRAIIDEGCRVPDGLAIGVDAEADRRLFHRTDSGVTLVTREMLENLGG
ncbi:glucose-1-phosphate adenylyltransferase [Plasticicumulans lactativorans]|uniref:Glucose-1-phosphate adenylyltransferase n=1 Tax=Plasticicumulans lactativorans TaxID=1133106 RepID=A0A4R2LBB2_9GAMM|nr:glucose-1-phosphate adenylyltransferase [Plasticicumulans lactativorans]TCO81668.1 glucose-1-phosphate adenylyltransferase [Plasticicumulans lactativorans]